MSRQEAGRDPGKSLAQPANSVSFFVNRRVSQAGKGTHFLPPCTHDALIWRVSFSPAPVKGVVTQV